MRGLSKPWPPRNVSPDGQAPRRFADAEREYLTALPGSANRTRFARTEFDRLDKGKLREVLSGEQASLCVYWERRLPENGERARMSRISENREPARIEHWIPRSGAPEYALHWRNLYLSCATIDTCERAKGNRRLRWDDADPDLPWPTELDYERLVGFDGDGRMYVRNDVNIDEATRKALELAIDDLEYGGDRRRAILNLNHRTLVTRRRAALDSERRRMEKDFENRTATRAEREQRATRLLGRERLPAFVSIRVAWLRKTLGRGR